MRRVLALLSVAALAAVVVGAAATLAVDGGAIQAGEDLTLTCDDDGVEVLGWGLEDDEPNVGLVFTVRIGDISDDCFGNSLFVNITDGDQNVIGQGEIREEDGGIDSNEVSVGFGPVDAEDIEDIHVFIEGPNSSPDTAD